MCFVGWDEQANVFLDITKIREKLGSVIGEGFILPNRLKPSLRVRKTEYQAILYFSITSLVPASTRWDKQLPAESKERTASLLRTHVVAHHLIIFHHTKFGLTTRSFRGFSLSHRIQQEDGITWTPQPLSGKKGRHTRIIQWKLASACRLPLCSLHLRCPNRGSGTAHLYNASSIEAK